jgi:signal peptidase II
MRWSEDPRVRLAGLVGAAVLGLDQVTKAVVARTLALHETIELGPLVALTYVRNAGAAFGVLATLPATIRLPLLLGVTVVAFLALWGFLRGAAREERALVAALGAVLGGAAGNLVCRLRFGEVIDFVDLHWRDLHWPAFNVADAAITLGVAVVLWRTVWPRAPEPGAR